MRIRLAPGETLTVGLEDENGRACDGELTIAFDVDGNKQFTVTADMPDSDGRNGLIYDERFGEGIPAEAEEVPVLPECGKHGCARRDTVKVLGSLTYNACPEHRAEIEELTDNE